MIQGTFVPRDARLELLGGKLGVRRPADQIEMIDAILWPHPGWKDAGLCVDELTAHFVQLVDQLESHEAVVTLGASVAQPSVRAIVRKY